MMGAFAEMSEDVSRICDIIAHELARTHVSYYNDDARRTKGMYRKRIQKAWGPPLYLLSAVTICPSEPGGWPLSSSILAARLR